MKRFASALLVFALLLCAAGCSDKGGNKSNDSSKDNNGSNISSNTDVNWPTGATTIFVGAQAGSNLDLKARIVAKYLTEELGVAVVVENRPGGGGITSCTQYLSESANTNNIQYLAASYVAVAPIYNEVDYTADDFITVAGVDSVDNGFFVDANLGINSVDDLVAYGKDNIIKFASTGVGSDTFLLSRALMEKLGLESDTVVGGGFPDMILSTISGTTQITYCSLETARQYVADGSLIPIATCTPDAYTGYAAEGFASVPSLNELGYGIEYSTITWLALRSGTDDAIVAKLASALDAVYANAEFQKEMKDAGFFMLEDPSSAAVSERIDTMVSSCQEFADLIAQ